ncbi:MAG: antitoxin Xre/MbcA/ParS toxin-binding domain-containing protein [Pseudomonas profundi]|uniref:antitoxin Xre/MbcA/ParS toxin-binding domain-containing protein n=1 Tax=Pseudomonas profundi TaxID=1981513 RepID=UPI0030015B2E
MSDRKVRYDTAVFAATGMFGGRREDAERWLRGYVQGLGKKPVELLDSDEGLEAVLDMIGRLEHGVFS